MTPDNTHQLATEMLLSGFMSVLALGILSTVFTMLCLRLRRHSLDHSADNKEEQSFARTYQPSAFEQSCRWCVVKGRQISSVQRALGLHNPIPCSWGEGTSRLTGGKLFVSAPIRGWILVMGQGLPDPGEDVDRCFHFIRRLSHVLGQVQFFSSNRAANHHAWIWAEGGHIRRAYAWAGETLWNQGELTSAERELGVKCLAYTEKPEPIDVASSNSPVSNSEKVTSLAARWSFDPTSINESRVNVGLGVAGVLHHSRRN
jgi:hypothetical protein